MAVSGTGTGVVTPTVGTHSYLPGALVWMTAAAAPGSTFAGWSGAVSGLTNPISLTMDGNKTVTATFDAVQVCTDVTGVNLVVTNTGTIYTDTLVYFSADILPDNANKPYTYTVDYGSGASTPALSSADPLRFTHTFAITGTHTVTFSAWNCAMHTPKTDSITVTVSASGGDKFIYLPLVLRNYQ